MAATVRLPDEILCMIARHVESQNDRYHLVLCCRRFRYVLLPILYSDVILVQSGKPGCRRVSRFLHTIISRPSLAMAVRTISLGPVRLGTDHEEEEGKDRWYCRNSHVWRSLERSCLQSEFWSEVWYQATTNGSVDCWLTMLLPMLTNVRKISFTWMLSGLMTYVYQMLERTVARSHLIFPYLTEAHADFIVPHSGFESSVMFPLFDFRLMKKITVRGLSGINRNKSCDVPWSNIIEINLDDHNNFYGMRTWTSRCKELKVFRMNHHSSSLRGTTFDLDAYFSSLAPHESTLETVWIAIEREEDYVHAGKLRFAWSFAGYTVLKNLHLRLANLLHPDGNRRFPVPLQTLLPPSIETLYLGGFRRWLTKSALIQLEDLVRSHHMLRLRRLDLEGESRYRGKIGFERALINLQKTCAEAGVHFVFWTGENRHTERLEYVRSIWPA